MDEYSCLFRGERRTHALQGHPKLSIAREERYGETSVRDVQTEVEMYGHGRGGGQAEVHTYVYRV